MANEKKKDFNAMLHDSKDMPKFQTITDRASIEKYGGDRMYFAPPIDYGWYFLSLSLLGPVVREMMTRPLIGEH